MLRLLTAIMIAMLFVPAAGAASFDCGKAGTAFERAICTNPELSRLDEVLAQAYATALGGLSRPAADVIKATQHEWLGYAERVCTPDAEPLQGDYSGDQIGCLNATIRSRLKNLEASRMMSEYRFYPIDYFATMPDPEATADSFPSVADKTFSTVKIDRSDDFAKSFNAMIDTDIASFAELFGPDGQPKLAEGDAATDNHVATTVTHAGAQQITLRTDAYWFSHGAAHGDYGITYLHFLTDDKRLLRATDIFSGKEWKAHLGELVLDELQRTIDGGVWEDSVNDIPGWSADPARWDFSDTGLIVQFQPYEVTAYAAGAPTVTIPWDALSADLAEKALEIATY